MNRAAVFFDRSARLGGGSDKGKEKEMKELTVEASVEKIEEVTRFVNEELSALDCPKRARTQIDIAIDEIFANIAAYAYGKSKGEATVSVEFTEDPVGVRISFADGGMPFDPLTKEDPDTAAPAEKRTTGGLGIFLVKKIMDEVEYRRENGRNILSIRKYF